MKNPISYIRRNGIGHLVDVFWKYKADRAIRKVLKPVYQNKPLKDMILIESHNDFDCNGGAFYDYLIANGYNKNYEIVLFLKNRIPDHLPPNVSAVPLRKPSLKKDKALLSAKYMLSDNDFLTKNRPDQISVYCTHGSIGLKNCAGAIDVPDGIDYVLGASRETADIYAWQYALKDLDHQLVYLGYPIHDFLYHPELQGDLHKITDKPYAKTVLWMPTFRKGGGFRRNDSTAEQALGIPLIRTIAEYNALNEKLKADDMHLIIKIHPMQDLSNLGITDLSNITVLTGQKVKELGVDNYRLMHDVDALISDYSSAAYDWLPLNRPVAYTLDDAEEYKNGFIVEDPKTMMAGHEIYTLSDMENFLDDIAAGKDPYRKKREELTARLFSEHDGDSCKRLAEFLQLKKPQA